MRAVNLIPAGDRRGAGGAAGRSNGGVYILLGALALIVVMAGAYTLSGKSVDDKKAELARVNADAAAAQAKSAGLSDYTKFAALRTKRVDTVKQLAASRFDWAHALHEVARVIPTNAWFTTLNATTTPGAGSAAGGGALRGALPVPAIEITGCTTSQGSVARVMARLRLIDGVEQVSLQDSTKTSSGTGGAGDSASGGDCTGGSSHFPKFQIVVFYKQPATAAPSATGGTATAAAVTASGTTPGSTTAPGSTAPASSTAASGGSTP
jgi:Tfp pilus assembly protein PilN